jgi:hypothetical protein
MANETVRNAEGNFLPQLELFYLNSVHGVCGVKDEVGTGRSEETGGRRVVSGEGSVRLPLSVRFLPS